MANSADFKSGLREILEIIMLTDMGIYEPGKVKTKIIEKTKLVEALKALNSVKSYSPRSDVQDRLREAGSKLFKGPPADNKGYEWKKWALKSNLASSCLSIVFPQLAIGLCEWICMPTTQNHEKCSGRRDELNEILKLWATYNFALACKETKGGIDQAETKLIKIVDSKLFANNPNEIIKMAEASLRWPAFVQLCEIHKDRQEKTRFDKRRADFFEKILKKPCTCGKNCDSERCGLLSEIHEQESDDLGRAGGPRHHYRKYISTSLFLLCQEYKILSMRADCRKLTDSSIFKVIAEHGKHFLMVKENVQNEAGWKDLESKIFLLALEYIHEALLGIKEAKSKSDENQDSIPASQPENDADWQCLKKTWERIANFVHSIEDNRQKADRLFPERFEYWPKILKIAASEAMDKNEVRSLIAVLMSYSNNCESGKCIGMKLESLRVDSGDGEDPVDAIKKKMYQESMKPKDHPDPAIDEQLWLYREVIGRFNDREKIWGRKALLEDREIELIKAFIKCEKQDSNELSRWSTAKLCARRRFLEKNKCYKNAACWWTSTKKLDCKGDLFESAVSRIFSDEADADKEHISGRYLDRVSEDKGEDFKERLLSHSRHKELKKRFALACLRRWQSFTPALSAPQKVSRGGGYFVFRCDKNGDVEQGVVIDPGIYFLENFFEEGFSIQDIDVVLLTHHHLDHRDDLESILTLIHEAAKKGAPNNIKLVVTRGAWSDIDSMIRRTRENIDDIYTIEKDSDKEEVKNIGDKILINWEYAYHNCFDSDSVGYQLRIEKRAGEEVGFRITGDTLYTPNTLGNNLKVDVIMLNLGGIVSDKKGTGGHVWKLQKLAKSIGNKEILRNWMLETGFLENHLYLAGALQLLSEWWEALGKRGGGLAILCELPEELSGGHRKTIAKAIQNAVNKPGDERIIVLPEDVGLRISYDVSDPKKKKGTENGEQVGGAQIECLYCSQHVKPEEIKVIPWGLEERLMFVCENCRRAADPYLLEEKFKYYRDRGRPFEKAES